jgi:hypothetical protein
MPASATQATIAKVTTAEIARQASPSSSPASSPTIPAELRPTCVGPERGPIPGIASTHCRKRPVPCHVRRSWHVIRLITLRRQGHPDSVGPFRAGCRPVRAPRLRPSALRTGRRPATASGRRCGKMRAAGASLEPEAHAAYRAKVAAFFRLKPRTRSDDRWAPRCCATGCMTWTASSAARWPTACSPCCLLAAMPAIHAFSARLRDEVDLQMLTTELLAVVEQTMQPLRVSLWLQPPGSVPRPERGARAPGA